MTGLERNEAHRWSYMKHDAMKRRLFKITNLEKLKLFIVFADKNDDIELKELAEEKLAFMNGNEKEDVMEPKMVVLSVKTRVATHDRGYRKGMPNSDRRGRVHLFVKDWNVMEDFLLRVTKEAGRCDEVSMFRRDVLPEVVKQLDLPEETKFRWSRKAGCSCGCSPGFVCKTDALNGQNVFVDYDVEV